MDNRDTLRCRDSGEPSDKGKLMSTVADNCSMRRRGKISVANESEKSNGNGNGNGNTSENEDSVYVQFSNFVPVLLLIAVLLLIINVWFVKDSVDKSDMTRKTLSIDPELLAHWNSTLANLKPEEIINWAVLTFPGLYQTTAFGLSGLCIIDMISKLPHATENVDLVFIDTLYHFPQTLELVEKVKNKYPEFKLHVYKPFGCDNEEEFVAKHGDSLWERDELKYDYLVKVEPLKRAYEDLQIKAVFTGRRQSQGANRSTLPIIEIDDTLHIIKINPLATWTFDDVYCYIQENNVPYNELLDLGYKSVGDWHSTSPVAEGEDERAGRWKGRAKTECGIHVVGEYKEYMDKKIVG
ncbi:unnamed protein product [Pichia kudriavzevii]